MQARVHVCLCGNFIKTHTWLENKVFACVWNTRSKDCKRKHHHHLLYNVDVWKLWYTHGVCARPAGVTNNYRQNWGRNGVWWRLFKSYMNSVETLIALYFDDQTHPCNAKPYSGECMCTWVNNILRLSCNIKWPLNNIAHVTTLTGIFII